MDGCYFSILNIFYFKEKSMLLSKFKCNKLGRNWHRFHCILNMHAMKSCAVLVALFSALAFSSRLSIVKSGSPKKVKSKTYENDSFGKIKISVFLCPFGFQLKSHVVSCRFLNKLPASVIWIWMLLAHRKKKVFTEIRKWNIK